jgi:creatinine amidohydrolase
MKHLFTAALACALLWSAARAQEPPAGYYLEELTWTEVRDRMKSGTDTIIIPTGGTEQNGPHIAIGKHNWIARHTSGEIARELGNALAAPVLAYVPEGPISPPSGHMAFPGTISARDESFGMILEDAARSFKAHGFKRICFIGDHGGSQDMQKKIAEKLSREWKNDGVTVLQVDAYYTGREAESWARALASEKSLPMGDPMAHAGFMDTAEAMAVHARAVRTGAISAFEEKDFSTTGVTGNPSAASARHGRRLLRFKVKAAVEQIRAARGETGK